jgi:hypothetical protein
LQLFIFFKAIIQQKFINMNSAKQTRELCLFQLFERFIADSKNGKRLQANGTKICAGTIKNYFFTLKTLKRYAEANHLVLRIRPLKHLNGRQIEIERNYWKKFYKRFCDFLYKKCDYYDNYAGSIIKNLKVFFSYLNKDLALGIGDFHKRFYVRKEAIQIFPLLPEELNYLIYNQAFEKSLYKRMQQVKDVFVFGCTVALRVSDLLALKKTNIKRVGLDYYLSVRSQKTGTYSMMRLPDYAIDIIKKYLRSKHTLLPHFNKSNLNTYIKLLLEQAGFTQEVSVTRNRRGKAVSIHAFYQGRSKALRYCDVASTHTMRRTAITTMLCLGMPEQLVRKISGHAPHTKEFYRYMLLAQAYQDTETIKVFDKLKEKSSAAV